MEHFNYIEFRNVMGIKNIPEAAYGAIFRNIFDYLLKVYTIDIDNATEISYDLQYAIYRHAKYLYEYQDKNLDIISATTDANGTRTVYEVRIPQDISAIYKMYSPNAIVSVI